MNAPLCSQEAPRAAQTTCFCGHACPPESYYCSPACAREDAFNSLTLGKPHEPSNPMAPLPTLPPGFFKLPPKRSLNEADELAFIGDDHGPFQVQPSRTNNRMTRAPRSVPRSITNSVASTAPSKRSEWRSHYRQTQKRESRSGTTEIPFFLVDEVENSAHGHENDAGLSPAQDLESLGLPTFTESRQQDSLLVRTGSFGIVSGSYQSLTCTEGDSLTPYDYTTDASKCHNHRSSSSSYNSLLTSATSRSSYTSVTGSLDQSPTKSLNRTSLSRSQPRLGYGSAFGGDEDKPLALDVVKMVADLRDSLLTAKRVSRKRSSTDATVTPRTHCTREEDTRPMEQPVLVEQSQPTNVVKEVPPVVVRPTPVPVKKASTSVPKSHWSQFRTTPSRSEQRLTTTITPLPVQSHAITATPISRPVLGTVVKTTTVASKGRLPIGTPQLPPTRPKTPSNVLPAGINLSLHSKSFRAPAYAMSAPKIPGSTLTLRTSASKKSLKSQKEDGHVRIPTMEMDDHQAAVEAFKASFEPTTVTEVQDSKGSDVIMINDTDAASSAQTGARFTLCSAPKPQREIRETAAPFKSKPASKNIRLTLSLDPASLDPLSTCNSDDTPRPSPPYADERSPSTAGAPLTPRATPVGSHRPVWLSPPGDAFSKAGLLMNTMQRTMRLGSNASHTSEEDDTAQAQVCVAQRIKMQKPPSFLRTTFDWKATPQ